MIKSQDERLEKFNKFYSPFKMGLFSKVAAVQKAKNQNKDFYMNYMNIVKKCAVLFRELKVNDSLTACALFQYLLWKGYFSKDKRLVYSMSGRMSLIGAMGADIMTGKSVCENNAEMLKDILNSMDFRAYIMGCILGDDESLITSFRPRLYCPTNNEKTKVDEAVSKFIDITSLERIGNHMVTLFKYKGRYYISDPTNLVFFNFDEVLKAKVVGGTGVIEIKPWVSLVYDSMTNEEFKQVMNATFSSVYKEKIKISLVKEVCGAVDDKCYCEYSLLESFYDDIKPDIDGVFKKLYK